MGSYASQLKNHQITFKQFLVKSVTYLKNELGLSVSDEAVDVTVKATDELTDVLEAAIVTYLELHLPKIPAEIAISAATAALATIDAAIAGAGNVIKENN